MLLSNLWLVCWGMAILHVWYPHDPTIHYSEHVPAGLWFQLAVIGMDALKKWATKPPCNCFWFLKVVSPRNGKRSTVISPYWSKNHSRIFTKNAGLSSTFPDPKTWKQQVHASTASSHVFARGLIDASSQRGTNLRMSHQQNQNSQANHRLIDL